MKFVKEVLRPGTYFQNGRKVRISREDVAAAHESLRRLATNGLHVPLILEHTDPSIANGEGTPMTLAEMKAQNLRRTVGYADPFDDRTALTEDGRLNVAWEVPDEATAEKLVDKRIRFVSPELRPHWTDGKGRQYVRPMTHVALTHRPIQVDQEAGFETISLSDANAVLQFSAEDGDFDLNSFGVITFADSDFHDPEGTDDAGSGGNQGENPDMPQGLQSDDNQKLSAIIQHLSNLGVGLPSDTDSSNLLDRLLTALLTVEATNNKVASEKPAEDSQNDEAIEEMNPKSIAQFSDTTPQARLVVRIRQLSGNRKLPDEVRDELLVRVGTAQFSDSGIETTNGGIGIGDVLRMYENSETTSFGEGSPQSKMVERIKQLAGDGKILPGVRDQLLSRVGVLQFSDQGVETSSGGVSMTDLLDSYERGANMAGMLLADQSDNWGGLGIESQEHPGGRGFMQGDQNVEAGSQAAVDIAEGLLKRTGMRRKPTADDVLQRQIESGASLPTA